MVPEQSVAEERMSMAADSTKGHRVVCVQAAGEMDMETEPKKQTAIEFAKAKLSINPDATFAEIKAQAKIEGLVVYPVVYGRAKALLGLVPMAPYGSKSKARKAKEAESSAIPVRNPRAVSPADETNRLKSPSTNDPSNRTSRARAGATAASGGTLSSLEGMIADLKLAVLERDRYRATLEKIAELIKIELSR